LLIETNPTARELKNLKGEAQELMKILASIYEKQNKMFRISKIRHYLELRI